MPRTKGATVDIGDSFQNATDSFFAFLPNLLGFLVILLVGFIVAKVVAAIVRKVLEKVGLDRRLHESDARRYVDRVMPQASPSNGIARAVFWLIFIFFIFSAIGALQVPALTGFMEAVLAYLPNIIVAILIFVVAALIAGAVGAGVAKVLGDTPTGKVVATVVPAIVMVIAMFMILEQLQIAPEIVRIAFAATMGALALGLALAFGLGGRSVAERMLEDAYRKGRGDWSRQGPGPGVRRPPVDAGHADDAGASGGRTDPAGTAAGAWRNRADRAGVESLAAELTSQSTSARTPTWCAGPRSLRARGGTHPRS
jgi:hypothetical protein